MPTLPALFAAARAPAQRTLLALPGEPPVTYAAAWERAGRLAGLLRSQGARPGERVVVALEKSPLAVLLYLACVRSGYVYVPVNPGYTPAELDYLLADVEPAVVVTEPGLEAAAAHHAPPGEPEPGADDVAAILYTSGTTGRPKGAMLTQANLATNAAVLCSAWGMRAEDVLLHALPVFHAHGLFVALNCVLASGAQALFLPRFDAGAVVEQLPRCTVFMGVPTYYTRLLADPRLDRERAANVRLFVSGSAPLPAPTHAEFRERTGHAILERYGMTETLMIASNPLTGERRPGSVGPPLPGVAVRIGDPGPDGVGGVQVRGPNVFAGYWRRPELTATEFSADGYFRTGDLGRFDAEGYLHLVGRSKELVISGGLNVYPAEVEQVLGAHPAVLEAAVFGRPDADLGEVCVAALVARPGHRLDPAELRAFARTRLAGYKVPRRTYTVAELPRNAMGKVDKAALLDQLSGRD